MKLINLKSVLACAVLILTILSVPIAALASCPSSLAALGITQVSENQGDFVLPMYPDSFFSACGGKHHTCYETLGNAPTTQQSIFITLPSTNPEVALDKLNASAIFTMPLKPGGYNAGDCFARLPLSDGYIYVQVSQ